MLRPLMLALLGTSFTFLMTALGAATVFFFARKVCERAQGALLGFAAGVMMAASVWSLILPAIEQTEAEGRLPPFLPAAAGIVLGALTLGIGVQNFPEGAAVALPVYQAGKSKWRAFWTGVLSGAVEPLFGALVVLAAAGIHALMPWLLSFAAGAMLYVVAEELLPRAGGRRGTCGFLVGFLLMMILDVALG